MLIVEKMNPIINVLTRTHNRPNYFKHCRESVLSQKYDGEINHIISVDDSRDLKYVSGDITIKVGGNDKFSYPYNLYFSDMIHHVKEGWILHLDDDDMLTRPNSIQTMIEHISSESDLLLWKVDFREMGIVPKQCFGKIPIIGDISSIGFLVHSKHWKDWTPIKCGDFYVIEKYYKKLNPVWINDVLTGLQGMPGSIAKQWDGEE